MTKTNTLEMTAGNIFNLQDFEQNKIKSKQRSFADFIATSFVLIDADLLLIWMNNFQLCFRFHLASCPVLPAVLIISRGECTMLLDKVFSNYSSRNILRNTLFNVFVIYNKHVITPYFEKEVFVYNYCRSLRRFYIGMKKFAFHLLQYDSCKTELRR